MKFLKPNMAIFDLKNKQKPQLTEKFIWTESCLCEYRAGSKTICVYELPLPWWLEWFGRGYDDLLSLVFGVKAEEAIKRYDWKLSKDDPDYVYLDIVPKGADRDFFVRAQLVLTKGTYLTHRLWFEQPNGNEVTWDLPKTELNTPVDRTLFKPQAPPGWTIDRIPKVVIPPPIDSAPRPTSAPPPAKVYRPN